MTRRSVRSCDRCGAEIGTHIYRVQKVPNDVLKPSELVFAPLDLIDFCSLRCLLDHYVEHGETPVALDLEARA